MAPPKGMLQGRITIPTGGWGGTIDGSDAFTVAAGTYYWSSADVVGGGSSTFLEAIDAALDGSASAKTFTVALSLTTGKITITPSSACSLEFGSTSLRDLLGYSGNQTSAASHVGGYQVRNLWLPNCPYNAPNAVGVSWRGWRESDIRENENAAGYGWHHMGQEKVVNALSWGGISRAKTWTANESTVNESWERFCRDAVWGVAAWGTPGGPVRFHPDETSTAVFATYRVFGMQNIQPEQVVPNYVGIWAINLPRLVQVPGTETEGD